MLAFAFTLFVGMIIGAILRGAVDVRRVVDPTTDSSSAVADHSMPARRSAAFRHAGMTEKNEDTWPADCPARGVRRLPPDVMAHAMTEEEHRRLSESMFAEILSHAAHAMTEEVHP